MKIFDFPYSSLQFLILCPNAKKTQNIDIRRTAQLVCCVQGTQMCSEREERLCENGIVAENFLSWHWGTMQKLYYSLY